jgi:hypothetical protein
MMAVWAFDAGEAFAQIPTFEVFSNYMGNYWSEKTVLLLKEIVIPPLELKKVMIEKLPQGGFLWFPSPVYFDLVAVLHTTPLLSARELS